MSPALLPAVQHKTRLIREAKLAQKWYPKLLLIIKLQTDILHATLTEDLLCFSGVLCIFVFYIYV